jgi:release factor glutamine methyltransferase
MDIKEALALGFKRLEESNFPNPHLEAELLLSISLKDDRSHIISHPEKILNKLEIDIFKTNLEKRLNHVPLAYISGDKSFFGLNFKICDKVLVPRPETEIMVEIALAILSAANNRIKVVADIGTGSGCIIAAICKNLKLDHKPELLLANDISPEALSTAKINFEHLELSDKITLRLGSLLEPLKQELKKIKSLSKSESKLLICANLPYLTSAQIASSPSIHKEPRLALDGGKEGMELYIELFRQVKEIKTLFPVEIIILAEIDHSQKDLFVNECKEILIDSKLKIIKDFGGYERIVQITL